MLKSLWASVLAFFGHHPSVASATSVIAKTVDALDAVAEHHNAQADAKSVRAGALQAEAADHQDEAGKAMLTAAKLEALLH
jgi:prefoldin subunit 5